MVAPTENALVGIRTAAELTGLSMDTLRWYEKQGLIPLVSRSHDGRRRYSPASIRFIRLVQALRRTGMPVADVRRFVRGDPGPDAHERRMAILQRQCRSIEEQIEHLHSDLTVVRDKIDHYRDLIARGLDCEDEILES